MEADQRTKSRETKEQLKTCETRDTPYTCRYMYAGGYLIPIAVMKTDSLGIKYPLINLQV